MDHLAPVVALAALFFLEATNDVCAQPSGTLADERLVSLRLKQYHSLALQRVPVGEAGPRSGPVVLFDLCFFGRRPGWRFGAV